MSNIKELIRAEIERRKVDALDKGFTFVPAALQDLLSFLDTLPDEPVTDCHDLEEAAENPYVLNDVSHAAFEYERTRNDLDARSDNEVVRRAFIAGAEWQKRKMMEGAVEGTVIELGETYKDLSLSVNAKELNQVLQPLGVGDGNKVKIIIVKEGEE